MQQQINKPIRLIPTKVNFIKTVKLELGSSLKPKFIGHINERDKIFRTKRNESQIYHKSNSIAFNYDLVNGFDIEIFQVEYKGEFLFITKEYLQKVGKVFQFRNAGAELQIFIPIKEFSHSIIEAKNKNDNQLTMFS